MEIKKIPVDQIKPNPLQTRKTFDETKLRELGESIKSNGLINPITVTCEGEGYVLVAGERRVRASELIGIGELDAIIEPVMEDDIRARKTLIENVHREDLTPLEKGFAIKKVFGDLADVDNFYNVIQKMRRTYDNVKNRSKLSDEEKPLYDICKEIGMTPRAVELYLKPACDDQISGLNDANKIKSIDVLSSVGGIKDKNTQIKVIKKINKDKIGTDEAIELIRAVKPLTPEDVKEIGLNKPIKEIKERSENIQYIRKIPTEELDSQIIKLQENKEVMEKAEKLTKELFGPGKTPETKKSKKAWLDFNNTVAFAESLKDVHCPICGDSKGADNLYWVCHDPPTKAIDTIGIAKERFEKLYKEAMRVKNLN